MKKLRSTASSRQALAALVGQVAPGRVLARALEAHQLHLVAREQALERVHVEAVLVHRHADHARAGAAHRGHHPDEGGGLDHRHVARLERGAGGQRDALLGARGDHDLVRALGIAEVAPAAGELLAQVIQSLGVEVGQCVATHLGEHIGGDARELVGGVGGRRRPAHGQRDQVVAPGEREGVGQHLLGVGELVRRQRIDLPVVARDRAARGRERAHEGAAAHLGGHEAALREAPVDARRGQVVDAGLGGQLARGRELGARLERTAFDRRGDAVHELLRDRDVAVALQVGQVKIV